MSLERARHFYELGRYAEARDLLSRELSEDPERISALYLYSLTLSQLDDHVGAHQAAQSLISLAPTWPVAHVGMARICLQMGRYVEGEKSARRAIEIDPEDDDAFIVLSACLASQKKWKEALAAAESAIAIDPESVSAHNMKSHALQYMGRRKEALEASMKSLSFAPDGAGALATHGMALLNQGKHREAEKVFMEALKEDPEMDFAREGILESLRSRFWPYKVVYSFHVWQSRFSSSVRWGLWLGMFLGSRELSKLSLQYPQYGVPIAIFLAIYTIFVFMTWTSQVLANGVLMLHPIGRFVLPKQDKLEGAMGTLAGLLGLAGAGLYLVTQSRDSAAVMGFGAITLLLIGMASHVNAIPGLRKAVWVRTGLVWIIGVFGLLLCFSYLVSFLQNPSSS